MHHRRRLGALASSLIVCSCVFVFFDRLDARGPQWLDAEIGSPKLQGSSEAFSDTLLVSGAGRGIGGAADQFHLRHATVSGDVDLRVLVGSLRGEAGMQAGLTIRESLAPGAAQASLVYSPLTGISFVARGSGGAEAQTLATLGTGAPIYLRLVRQGDVVAAFYSASGSGWTLIKRGTVPMGADVAAGIAVSGGAAASLGTATFKNVSLAVTPWANQPPSVAVVSPASGATFDLPASLTLVAEAADPDGAVATVDFFVDGARVGRASSAPYRVSWSAPGAGRYSIQAVAVDAAGTSAGSAPVTIEVRSSVSLPSGSGTSLQFEPSADHDELVNFYKVEIRRAADGLSSSPVGALNAGKPAIVADLITVDVTTLFNALPSGEYYAVVKAVGDGGAGVSEKLPFSW